MEEERLVKDELQVNSQHENMHMFVDSANSYTLDNEFVKICT
jgi:hypothetical protein